MVLAVALSITLLLIMPTGAQQKQQTPLLVSIKVEAEGAGWAQSATDLSDSEIATLQRLLATEISKQPLIQVVDMNDTRPHLHMSLTVAQVSKLGGGRWIIGSNVLMVTKETGGDTFAGHNVIAALDVPVLAKVIAYYFAAARLRLATGILQ